MMRPRSLPSVCSLAVIYLALAPWQTARAADDAKLPLSGLAPAKLIPDLCVVRYRVSTSSPECQAYFDQGLGYFYSYVWMEAARSFETAARYDPECAMAWWGLSRSMERWSKNDGSTKALEKAKDKQPGANHREQLLITARMQEKGLVSSVAEDQRKKASAKTVDDLLAVYDDDQEAWYYRAQLADSGLAAVPYYKSLLKINPLHPGANHELVHFYENYRRPALGWVYAENYIRSSPGIPHAFHMQAHLATRLGRWDKTSDRSAKAVELERAYLKEQGVKPTEDHQFSHHLETLMLSLTHDGRFAEARKIKDECQGYGFRQWLPWFRLHVAERDWDEAKKIVDHFRKSDKQLAAYLSAVMHLRQGNIERATAEVNVLQQAYQTGKNNRTLENRLWETQGWLMCQTGNPEGGLKLLQKVVDRTKDDYAHHAWGNGSYYMETWGSAALRCKQDETAEEAFLEALAHDPGSVRAALGMQVLCERQGRTEEGARFAEVAKRCWAKAEPANLEAELTYLREEHTAPKTESLEKEVTPSTEK